MRPYLPYTFVLLILSIAGLSFLLFSGCGEMSQDLKASPAYKAEIEAWQAKRIKRMTSGTSWLTLAGLYWLKEGENTFGGSKDNQIKFPAGKAPAHIGKLFLNEEKVRAEIKAGVNVYHEGEAINFIEMLPDVSGNPTVLTLDSLSWFVIKRGDKIGIRLRDRESRFLKDFSGIEMFPLDSTWRVKAKLDPYDPPKIIEVPNVLGTVNESKSPGALVFSIGNTEYRLDPLGELPDKPLFLIFADQTNGVATYGAGRFLSVAAPDSLGYTVIDFNKAYNPPCAFTAYATCPLPPSQNVLAIEVTAGEKNYGHH